MMWSHCIPASTTAIGLFNNSDTRLADKLRNSAYINDRMPSSDSSFKNRLDFDWTEPNIFKNYIRVHLERYSTLFFANTTLQHFITSTFYFVHTFKILTNMIVNMFVSLFTGHSINHLGF